MKYRTLVVTFPLLLSMNGCFTLDGINCNNFSFGGMAPRPMVMGPVCRGRAGFRPVFPSPPMRTPGRGMSMTMTFVQPMPISPPVIFNQPQNGQVNYNDNSRLEELQREVERLRSQVASQSSSTSSVQSSGSDYYRLQQDVDALKRKFVEQDRINDQVQNKFKRIDEALAAIGRAIQP